MDTKRVLILTYYWPPSGGAGVQRWLKFVKYLPQYGVTPVVVTVDPKKASYPVTDVSLNDEVPDEVEVIRTNSFEPLTILGKLVGKKHVPHAGFSNVNTQSVLQRILRFIRGNFFVPDARVGWNGYAYRAAKKVLRQHSFDAVITTGPPHSTHLVGLKLKRKLGVRWIADFRDPWTDIYYYNQLMHLPFVKRHDARLERKVLMEADEILTVGKTLKELLEAKKQENSVKILTNGFDPKDFEGFTRKKPEIFTITYMGTMAAQYNLQVFIEACQQLRNLEIPFRVRFV
ncbi:MAG: glycosyltransferase, partial [Bacteroidota bacterium]